MTDSPSPAMRVVVHGTNVTDETVAAVVVALSSARTTAGASAPAIPAWQLAGFHESRSDLIITRPQQLTIRGNKQW